MKKRATTLKILHGDRPVDYEHDPPDLDCLDCISGCENCQNGIVPWEWSINWEHP